MPQPEKMRMNQQLRNERLQRHWSQQELADLLGTTVISIKRWEHNVTTPSPYFRLKLTVLFGKSAEELSLLPESPLSAIPMETTADTPVETRSPSPGSSHLWSVPYLRNLFFPGRETILQQMHIVLHREQTVAQIRVQCTSGGPVSALLALYVRARKPTHGTFKRL